jgi:ABC-type multidrug transport system ATPase subunit
MQPAIEVLDLRKRYDETEALSGVSFQVALGEVFCMLGPNGAGKTTCTEILEGHRLASSGTVSVLGHDPAKGERDMRERIGVVLQSYGIQEDLTGGADTLAGLHCCAPRTNAGERPQSWVVARADARINVSARWPAWKPSAR